MKDVDIELLRVMRDFKAKFGDIVPIMQIPINESTESLIKNIKECLRSGENKLPKIYKYGKYGDKNVIY
jgi:hypothetical protein